MRMLILWLAAIVSPRVLVNDISCVVRDMWAGHSRRQDSLAETGGIPRCGKVNDWAWWIPHSTGDTVHNHLCNFDCELKYFKMHQLGVLSFVGCCYAMCCASFSPTRKLVTCPGNPSTDPPLPQTTIGIEGHHIEYFGHEETISKKTSTWQHGKACKKTSVSGNRDLISMKFQKHIFSWRRVKHKI